MNAVFERDYVRTSVAPRYLWMRAGFGVAVATIVVVLLAGSSMTGDFTDVGHRVLGVSVFAGLTLLGLAVPGTFGASLVHARAQNTLPILFASPITPFQVAWGAFLARAAGLAVFVFACWPPVAIALAYGGIRPGQVLVATAALLGALLLLAAPAYVISAWARSTGPAIVGSYLAAVAALSGLAALADPLRTTLPFVANGISPFHALQTAIDPVAYATPGGGGGALLLVLGGAMSLCAVALVTWRLRAEARGGVDADVGGTAKRGYLAMRYENPVLDRELRTGGSLRSKSAGRNLVLILTAAECAYLVAAWKGPGLDSIPLFGGFLAFETALLVLASAAAGATSLAAEKETGALDVIRVTPLTPRQIIEGKLLGLLRGLLPSLVVPLAHLGVGVCAGVLTVPAIPAYLVAGAVVAGTWTVVGMAQSLDQRDPHRAVLRTMGILGIVGFLFAGYGGWALHAMTSGVEEYVRLTAAGGANPLGAILGAVAPFRCGGSDAETSALAPPSWGDASFGIVVNLVSLAAHLLVAVFVVRRLVHLYRTRFDG